MIEQISIKTKNQGLHDITQLVSGIVHANDINSGLCTLFIRHTSASLLIQENADPSARQDLENWMNQTVPENSPLYSHTAEGPDDMPAHIKSMLTQTSISIPVLDSSLVLGSWQGLFLFEHRHGEHTRQIIVHLSTD
jgi:secondary thiamine-phosphate synthase enzyme